MKIQNCGVLQTLNIFGEERVLAAIDTESGRLGIHGWKDGAPIDPVTLGKQLFKIGIRRVVYTNILKDGSNQGIDVQGTELLKNSTGLKVIASGGCSSLSEISMVRSAGLNGLIIGKALYDGRFSLKDALAC